MLNNITLMGRLTADPELKTTKSDLAVTSFSLAVDRNYKNGDGEKETDFFNIVAWRQTAEFVCQYFKKGQLMALAGELQTRKYEDKSGSKRTAIEIIANKVYFADSQKGEEAGAQANTASTDFDPFGAVEDDEDDPLPF